MSETPDFSNTPDQPPLIFSQSLRRIEILTGALGAVAVAVSLVRSTWQNAAGVGLGVIIAAVNFYLIQRLAQSIGKTGESRTTSGSAVGFGLRFLILGSAIFVIIKNLGIGPAPVLFGLLVPAGAVLVESIHLLIAPSSKSDQHQ